MRLLILILLLFFQSTSKVLPDCTCKGKALAGRARVVSYNPDFRVKAVEGIPDLDIRMVSYPPHFCGEWRLVDKAEDFTIMFVEYNYDFTVHYVNRIPGIPTRQPFSPNNPHH